MKNLFDRPNKEYFNSRSFRDPLFRGGNDKKIGRIGDRKTVNSFVFYRDIMERGYIKKENIDGLKKNCIDFCLKNSIIKEDEKEREFCGEKNKLVIQETGVLSIEFLKKYYGDLFDYSYTKQMEIRLDKIKEDSVSWNEICRETYNNIKEQTKKIKNNEKGDYILDEFNTLKFLRYGPVVEHKNDINGEIEFLPIKQNIVFDIDI